MKEIIGNLLDTPARCIIVQQVNCIHPFGAGLAKQIAKKWPHVEQQYKDYDGELGDCLLVQAEPGILVANLYGQNGVGVMERQTNYGALALALTKLKRHAVDLDYPVYYPYLMSSNLAGGDWAIVLELISFLCPGTIVKLPRYVRTK